jgi:hypothetical protein
MGFRPLKLELPTDSLTYSKADLKQAAQISVKNGPTVDPVINSRNMRMADIDVD